MIRFDNVSKLYSSNPRPALNNVSLEILKGEFVFLVGASGSGKSSFLRLVLREEKPSRGDIHVLGQQLTTLSSRKVPYFDGIGWVRFEPTVGRGDIPTFDDGDDSTNPSNAPSATPSASASARPSASPSASASSTAAATDSNDVGSLLVAAIAVGALTLGAIVVLLLPLLPALVRLTRRLRRYWRVSRRQSAADAWAEVSDTAIDLGWKADATTPKEFEDLVRPGMAEKGTAALERLRMAIEFTAYSRTPEPARIADVRQVRRAMRSASSRNDRMRARFSPRSVVLRGWRRR